jgi:hypothetical protein
MVVGNFGSGSACTAGPTDSKSNTWVAITNYGFNFAQVCIWYVANPTVGTGHTFSYSGTFNSIAVAAWSNVIATSPLDASQSGAATAGTSLNTGAATPTANNEMCLAGGTEYSPTETSLTFPSPLQTFTLIDGLPAVSGVSVGVADGYLVETTAVSTSTTYTFVGGSGGLGIATGFACFKHS